jgi:hypothetical protein
MSRRHARERVRLNAKGDLGPMGRPSIDRDPRPVVSPRRRFKRDRMMVKRFYASLPQWDGTLAGATPQPEGT